MKFTAYGVGRHMDSWQSLLATIFAFAIVMMAIIGAAENTRSTQLYRANVQAAEEFSRVVESGWPSDRMDVFAKLHLLRVIYLETGENDPSKLGEFERLQDWTIRAANPADEQRFLTEVRSHHGKLVMSAPWFVGEKGLIFILVAACVGCLGHICLWLFLRQQDARLRRPSFLA